MEIKRVLIDFCAEVIATSVVNTEHDYTDEVTLAIELEGEQHILKFEACESIFNLRDRLKILICPDDNEAHA